jgi:hypothetical protein
VELAIVVCVVLAVVVLLQIRHWHGRAVASLRAEELRRSARARPRYRDERVDREADELEPRRDDQLPRRRRAA